MPAAAAAQSCGNNKTVENICRLSPQLLEDTCQHVVTYLQGGAAAVDSAQLSESFQRAGVSLDPEALQSLIRFLLLTFRSAGKNQLSGDQLVSRLEQDCNKWSKEALQVLHALWTQHGASVHTQQQVQDLLSIGKLVDVQWKLGMHVSSDSCRSLNAPYVTLLLKVAPPSGIIRQTSFEMTIPQFQNFHKQLKEMAAMMETV